MSQITEQELKDRCTPDMEARDVVSITSNREGNC